MNVLSLFDGISCGQLALKKAGIAYDAYYASEIDKNAIKVTQHNFPNTIQIGDVTKLKREDLPIIDLLIGGSPCQGFSVAGKQLNFDDPRSKLFFEFVRLKNELCPKNFFFENVPMNKRIADAISALLGVGYIEVDSSDYSAQSRKRWYWTNTLHPSFGSLNFDTVEDILEKNVDEKYLINTEQAVIICESEIVRKKIAYIGTDSQSRRIYNIHNKSVTLCGCGGGGGAKTGLYALPCITPYRINKRQNGRRFKPPKSKFYTLTAQDRHGIFTNHFIRKLTPLECERLQTIPDDYTNCGLSDNQRYKLIGNAWTVNTIADFFKHS